MISNEKVANCSRINYYCKSCDYNTYKKSNYDKHITTPKHMKSINGNEKVAKSSKSSQLKKIQCDNCSKEYKDCSGLWRHKKKCNSYSNSIIIKDDSSDKNLIIMLLKENSALLKDNNDFKQMLIDHQNVVTEQQTIMMEVIKNGTNNTTNNTNSHNKTFNLQFFLNETCKDAMNIMDFVESIQFQISDLEKVGEIGYIDGISNIIVKNLKAMDITQRPLHCTDKKREVLYLKDEDKWEKQGEDNIKLRKVIRKVTDKNIGMITEYKESHPDCSQSYSRYSDEYNQILIESMGGPGDNNSEKQTKIIKNISKEVIVEKDPDNVKI